MQEGNRVGGLKQYERLISRTRQGRDNRDGAHADWVGGLKQYERLISRTRQGRDNRDGAHADWVGAGKTVAARGKRDK